MSAFLANLSVAAGILVIGLSLLMAVLASMAFVRLGAWRMFWTAVAFVGFLVQGILYTVAAAGDRADPDFPTMPVLSLVILLALYVAVLRR